MATSAPPSRIVGTSLKMYFDLQQTSKYIQGVADLGKLAREQGVELFVIPNFVSLLDASRTLDGTGIKLGAQDAFWEDSGAYTGEVSPLVLKQAGVKIIEIGHAERRRIFGETDEHVAKKAAAACRNNLIPLICIGEKIHGHIASAAVGIAIEECRAQVNKALAALPEDAEVILAYEPVWAIGASQPADPDHVVTVTKNIRKMTEGRKGATRILYGGSAGPGTFSRIAEGVDGLFLGRFAHDLENLRTVIMELGSA
jgi:triosephosphate isomerase